jgi:hypothetical protein
MIRIDDDRWIRRAGIADTKTARKGKLCGTAARSRLQRAIGMKKPNSRAVPGLSERPLRP